MADPHEGVAFCSHRPCTAFDRPAIVNAKRGPFRCSVCSRPRWVEVQRGRTLSGKRPYGEVRVFHDFTVCQRRYRHVAVVRDESLGSTCGRFALWSPFTTESKQALELAESLLWLVNASEDHEWVSGLRAGSTPSLPWQEILDLGLPREAFSRELRRIVDLRAAAGRRS